MICSRTENPTPAQMPSVWCHFSVRSGIPLMIPNLIGAACSMALCLDSGQIPRRKKCHDVSKADFAFGDPILAWCDRTGLQQKPLCKAVMKALLAGEPN